MTSTVPPAEEIHGTPTGRSGRGCLWRLGCLAIWLPLILLPLLLFMLAVQGEVSLWHNASFPAGAEHPALQAKLLMDIDTRGLNVTRSYIATSSADNNLSGVQTVVLFLLWHGISTPADYCDCYARDTADVPWTLQSTAAGQCK